MVNVTFWTCVKIGFGITLGHQLAKRIINGYIEEN